MNKNISRICRAVMAAVLVAMISSFSASAYPTSFFASTSKLSTGKWVRVSVDHDGVYQLTATELRQMGFNDINRVKIYGQGGHMLNEVLDGTSTDDLIEQATAVFGDKLCFYGRGPLEVYMDVSTTPVSFKRRVNGYSTVGCYFLTEGDNPKRVPQRTWIAATGGANHSVSYNWMLHERELSSLSLCGKDLLGEDLRTQVVSFPYSLPNLSSPTLGFQMRGVATCSDSAFVSASMTIGGQKVNVPYEDKYRKMPPTPNLTHYSSVSPLVAMTLPSLATTGQININPVTSKKTFDAAQLDYVMVTYQHTNTLAGETDNQTRIYLTEATLGDTITMTGGGNVMLWNVDDDVPAQMAQHIQGNLTLFNIARSTESPTMHVAFDPTLELSHITSYEPVANQNLHGAPTPDMIIVTHLNFLDQANQLADLHRSHDHADVLVVTEQEVFNEFSSGTRDAMAVRLMCKMFYDRDPQKMKYLLLFGQGTYDNRGLSTVKPGSIITFEADESASETAGYAPDDFFGILDDGSGGKNLSSGKVRLGVGRITPAHVHEAQGDVDKIIKYVTQPDYGVWRNNAFIAGDQAKEAKEGDLHIHQAQGICTIIENTCGVKLTQKKDFIPMFPKSSGESFIGSDEEKSVPEANHYMANALREGQYFATYVGHAGSTCFSGTSRLWLTNDVMNTPYEHLPIMTTACCNVARFDGNSRGIAEHMFHKVDGGCIAMLVATREVLASGNDQLNRAFTQAMFTLNNDGTMPTLGQVTMRAKQSLLTGDNKLNFMLLGDPMIAVNFPRPLINVTKVNGSAVNGDALITVSPQQQLNIEAQVLKQDKSGIDDTFTGEAMVTIYDAARLFKYATQQKSGSTVYETRRIDYPRTMITQVDAQVVKGKINAQVVLPRNIETNDTTLRVSIYAHKAGSDEMANCLFDNLIVGEYNPSVALTDNQAPVIETMYMGNDAESFAQRPSIGQKSVLHITATDDIALMGVTEEVSNGVRLILDHGYNSYSEVKHYLTMSNGGKRMDINFPINGLSIGRHNLKLVVSDAVGNSSERSIDFTVDQTSTVVLQAEESTVTNEARFVVTETSLHSTPEVTIKVTDAVGNLVWQTTTSTMPCVWNLKGLDGKRVAGGLYRYWCTYDTDEYYGGSPIGDLIVLEQ